MYLSVWLVVGALACAYVGLWMRGRRARALLKGLPCFYNLPFIGSTYKLLRGGEGTEVLYKLCTELSEIANETELPFVLWAGPIPMIVFTHEEDFKVVCNTYIEKPYYYGFMKTWLGNGIFTAPGTAWKRSIKMLAGTFTTPIVDGYQGIFNKLAQTLVDGMKEEVGRAPFNPLKHLTRTTLEAICQTALGVPSISKVIPTEEYVNAINRTMELVIHRGINLLLHPETLFRLSPSYRELKENVAVIQQLSKTIINKLIKLDEEKVLIAKDTEEFTDSLSTKFKSYADILIGLRGKSDFLTPEQIKAEVDSIIFAGLETTANTCAFALVLIGSHPEVQDKMCAEIQEIFGDSKRPIEKNDLERLQYCEAVIFEALRLYPPGIVVFRYADKELKLKHCTVPEGAACCINLYGAGRLKSKWGPDAAEFRPDRWLEPGFLNTHSPYIPFSYGRRSCIGKKYAFALLKTMLTYSLRELRISSEAEKLRLSMKVTLTALSGNLISVQPR